jgi:hypothetical protein
MPRWLTKAEVSAEEEAIRQEVTMDITPDSELVPIDGAVAELTRHGDGTVTAEIRIPGPPVP